MGGLLWWEDQIILGCYNLRDLRDEVSCSKIYSNLELFEYLWAKITILSLFSIYYNDILETNLIVIQNSCNLTLGIQGADKKKSIPYSSNYF